MRTSGYFYCSSLSFIIALVYANKEELDKHLQLGNQLLAKAQFADALTHYHAAIELDPTNYQTLYRRATVYLAMGKSKNAIPDLDKVLQLKSDFIAARIQRGNVLLKQGEIDAAANDFNSVLSVESSNSEVTAKVELIEQLRQIVHQAKSSFEGGDYASAEYYLNQALEHMMWDASLYRMRAKCYENSGMIRKAIADMRTVTKLVSDSTQSFLDVSLMYYAIGDVEESLGQIRECLKLDPDHQKCFDFYKKVKKFAKMKETMNDLIAKEDWMGCLDKGQQMLKQEKEVEAIQLDVYKQTCKCNREAGHIAEAIQECTLVLQQGDDVEVLCDRAEAYLLEEDFDSALTDYNKALEVNSEFRRAKEGIDRVQKLKKQAGKRDYYKILGVKR
ncbi:hypothetical protein WR25_00381 [Diploscapter pachys]|uniref:MalT-like TPR region domain-containing protein n=1 Tax=Diploscapter pachys TaxID=2018661 RepID=A0A2A2JYT9_9BILA|nr:hypothetical protein WR25_00381 [Diploscapter pachys]